MAEFVTYKSLQIVSPEPTEDGGAALNDNFRHIADELEEHGERLDALGTASLANTGTSSGNVPVLDAQGKLAQSVLPGVSLTDTFVVASQAAMLALTAQTGDVAVRTDLSKTFILRGESAASLEDWQELLTPIHTQNTDTGTTSTTFQLASGNSGPLLKSTAVDTIQLKNESDSSFINLHLNSISIFGNESVSGNLTVFTNTTLGTTTRTNTSGQTNIVAITPTYNQASGNAANTDLLVNRTQTAVGSGTQRLIDLQVGGVSQFNVGNNGRAFINEILLCNSVTGTGAGNTLNLGSSTRPAAVNAVTATSTYTNTTGNSTVLRVIPTYNQASGTAANTDFLINRTETAVGSGTQLLIDAQVGGVSQFSVTRAGLASANAFVAVAAIGAPDSPARGTIYFDDGDSHFYGWNGTSWIQLDN